MPPNGSYPGRGGERGRDEEEEGEGEGEEMKRGRGGERGRDEEGEREERWTHGFRLVISTI